MVIFRLTQQALRYRKYMSGKQLKQIDVTGYGETSVTLSAGMLGSGMYLYSLVIDGKVVDTKRMIVTD